MVGVWMKVYTIPSDSVQVQSVCAFFVLFAVFAGWGGKSLFIMPFYRITVKNSKLTGGQRVERGMSVDVVSNSFSNPVISDKAAVANAFYRIYGVDIQAIGALSTAYLDCIKIGR